MRIVSFIKLLFQGKFGAIFQGFKDTVMGPSPGPPPVVWEGHPFYDSLHRARMLAVKRLPQAKTIVDLGGASGEGEGALVGMGYPYHFEDLWIIDLPPENRHAVYGDLGHFREVVQSKQGLVHHVYASMTDLSRFGSGTVDLVFSGESIEHITCSEAQTVCQEAFRVLKPGGFFCLDTPNRAVTRLQCPDSWVHPEHKHEYTHREMVPLLEGNGFVIREAKGISLARDGARAGVFSPEECMQNEGLYDDIENCYLLFYQCQKPG
jgi:SAM-dependent methyltransferase